MKEDRLIFLKGEIYECGNTYVMCTETTCSHTCKHFKGVVVAENKSITSNTIPIIGSYSETWLTNNFETPKEKIKFK